MINVFKSLQRRFGARSVTAGCFVLAFASLAWDAVQLQRFVLSMCYMAIMGACLIWFIVSLDSDRFDELHERQERTIELALSRISELEGRLKETEPAYANESEWPWGSHHTEALGHLKAAAQRWWKLYDPTEADTAPTNKQVSEWLQEERGLSQKMAYAIASILRVDGLPTGPRK